LGDRDADEEVAFQRLFGQVCWGDREVGAGRANGQAGHQADGDRIRQRPARPGRQRLVK
jgi:hypothetical protein